MLEKLLHPAWTDARQPRIFVLRRAAAIVSLVRRFTIVFAALTVAWIPIDIAALPGEWQVLAAMRLAAAGAFALLGARSRLEHPTRREAQARLAALFLVPAAFYLGAHAHLSRLEMNGVSESVAATYEFLPFIVAAGVAAFPLSIAESASIAALAFGIQAYAAAGEPAVAWRLFLVASIAIFASGNQMRLFAALVTEATRDPLTGCLRREAGLDLLAAQLRLAERRGEPFAVLFADLDRFKSVNDRFGHEEGDRVLATAAESLRAALRGSDVLLRWGGEEFVALLPAATLTDAVKLVERLREKGAGNAPDGAPVTLSVGVAEYRADEARTGAELVEVADRRMYMAKAAGRNRFVATRDGIARVLLVA